MSNFRDFNENNKVVQEDRGPALGELPGENQPDPKVSVRDRIPEGLRQKLEKMDMGQKVVDKWSIGNSLRAEQLERQRKLLIELDEFMEPIYRKPQEWMADLHLPIAYTICKTFHARMVAALLGQDPPFQVKARKEANTDRSPMIQDLMSYTIKGWINNFQGIENVIDDYVWAWCTSGRGILKMRWEKQFTRFVDVEERQVEGPGQVVNGVFTPTTEMEERAIKKDVMIFEGPMWEHVPDEDVLIIGGNGDPDNADFVCHQVYMTPHELWTKVDAKIFSREAVEEVLEAREDLKSAEEANIIKSDRTARSGEGGNVDSQEVIDRHQILEAYLKVDLDNSGISSDVIMWVHKKTRTIVRATFLQRVMKTGTKPFAVADFYRRKGQTSAIGLVELTYTLTKEMDAMHNMKIDFGVLSTLPIGFYRASSSLRKERLPLTPGNLIPLNDPIRDINFPNMGNRTAFAAAEEQALFGIISRVTGISDLQLGVLGAQGVARTATGARTVTNESNANLDIFLRRVNRGFKKALVYTFQMLQQKLPPGLEFRLTGSDGRQYFRKIQSRLELAGMYDFEIEPNSANSNPSVRLDRASQVFQLSQNPILLQMGIVTVGNVFEATKNFLQAFEIKDWSRFITQPADSPRIFTPEEIANRALEGTDFPLTPEQDLLGFLAFAQDIIDDDEKLGQFNEVQTINLARKMKEAQQLAAAVQQAQAQQANINQIQQNAQLSTNQTAPGAPATGGDAEGGIA